jgi:hypothetical protein
MRQRSGEKKKEWLQIKEEIVQKEIISYNKIMQLKKTFLHSRRQVRKSSEKKTVQGLDEMREAKLQIEM